MKRRSFLGFDPSVFAAAALFFAVPATVLGWPTLFGGGFVSAGAPLPGTGISVSGTTVSVDQTSSLTWTGTETFNTHAAVLGTGMIMSGGAVNFSASPIIYFPNAGNITMKDGANNQMFKFIDDGASGSFQGGQITGIYGGTTASIIRMYNSSGSTYHGIFEPESANSSAVTGHAVFNHVANGSGTPTSPTAGSGCGTSSAANNAGGDVAGSIGVTCGSGGTTTNPYVTITWAHAYTSAPYCTLTPANAATAGIMASSQIYPTTSTTVLNVICGGGTCGTGTYLWNYKCVQ